MVGKRKIQFYALIATLLILVAAPHVNALEETDAFVSETNNTNATTGDVSCLNCTNESLVQDIPVVVPIDLVTVVENHADKLNEETKAYLKEHVNSSQEVGFLIKLRHSSDTDVDQFTNKKSIEGQHLAVVDGKVNHIIEILSDNNIEAVELDQQTTVLDDSIPYYVTTIGASAVHNITVGADVNVAVLDTGVASHSDLSVAGGYSVVSDNYTDTDGHGTAVIGVLNAQLNNAGLVGVCPGANVYAVKIMNGSSGHISDAIAGIQWAIDNNISIVSMSFGTETHSQIFADSLKDASDAGILLVAAAGNTGADDVLYPAAYSTVMAIGAVDDNNALASFSSYGSKIDLVAPGVNINTTAIDGGYAVYNGTSFAAPQVAGVAVLIKSYNTTINSTQLRAKLEADALDLGSIGKDNQYGYGLVQTNLTVANYTPENLSYFFKVYNISDYGEENISYTYWLNATGTIEDISFEEGYYLIWRNDTWNYTLHVNENGTVQVLTDDLTYMSDSYTIYGGIDGIVWTSGSISFSCADCAVPDTVCYDYDGGGTLDECWGRTSAKLQSCNSSVTAVNTLCSSASGPTKCHTSGVESTHSFPPSSLTSIAHYHWSQKAYETCAATPFTVSDLAHAYVIDKVNTTCSGTTGYTVSGRWDNVGTPTWQDIATVACPTGYTCDSSRAGYATTDSTYNYTSSDGGIHDPCVNVCQGTGSIQVNTETTLGAPIANLRVYLDNVDTSVTNSIGQAVLNLTSGTCTAFHNVTVKCSDNATVCGTQYAQIPFSGANTTLNFDCSICTASNDLLIRQDSVWVDQKHGAVNVTVFSYGINGTVEVNITPQADQGLPDFSRSKVVSVNVTPGGKINATFTGFTLNDKDYLNIYVDPRDQYNAAKEDNTNNYLFRPVLKPIKVYLSVNLDPSFSNLTSVITEYVGSFTNLVPTMSEADFAVYVGDPCKTGIGTCYLTKKIVSNGNIQDKPYVGIISFKSTACHGTVPRIIVYGNRIEGTLAAVKRMVDARTTVFAPDYNDPRFCATRDLSYVNNNDSLGIRTYDILHSPAAFVNFYQNNLGLQQTVRNLLFDNNYEVSVYPVQTLSNTSYNQSTILRVKHVNTDFTESYRAVFASNATPIVFSGGIFTDLTRWEDNGKGLASTLANSGRDVWEIEINGGPNTDCDSCANYTFQDQVNHYWPASMAAIQHYSGQNKLNYVGHSNGCVAALASLNNYSAGKQNAGYYFDYGTGTYVLANLTSQPVDRFVGVACPTLLNGNSPLTEATRAAANSTTLVGTYSINSITTGHLTLNQYAKPAIQILGQTGQVTLQQREIYIGSVFADDDRISRNLMEYYSNKSMTSTSTFDVSKVNVTRVVLIGATPNDLIVPITDLTTTNAYFTITNKTVYTVDYDLLETDHAHIVGSKDVTRIIQSELQ